MSDHVAPRRSAARFSTVSAAVVALADELAGRLDRPLEVLDLGGGTGGIAVMLAQRGHHVTVVDPSADALAALRRRAAEAGVSDRVEGLQGDGDSLPTALTGRPVDLACCHATLEFVDDPGATLRALAGVLAPGGVLSVLVSGRLAAVLAKALAGEFGHAKAVLTDPDGRWGRADPLPRRFDAAALETLLTDAGLRVEQWRGTDVLAHLVPASLVADDEDRAALAELEELLVTPERDFLRLLGAGLHVVARRD